MATLKIRGESYSVIYLYTAADGQKKQQWETYVTELEALQRKTYIEYLQKNKMKKELQLAAVSYRQQRVHEKEEKERGYNQSELLAKEVGLRTGLSVFDNLKKVKETDRQKKLTAKERRENLKGVFDVVRADEIKGKNVLVIDDVYTTGATINECARVLKRAGARKVYSITAAQTAFKPDGEKGEIAEDNANALHKN